MSVTITISDDGHVEAQHNSGAILWEADVDPDSLPHDYACDKQISNGIEYFVDHLLRFASEDDI